MKQPKIRSGAVRILLVTLLAASLTAAPALTVWAANETTALSAASITADDFTYIYGDDDQITITGFSDRAASVSIPATIEGKSVTAIARKAFDGCTVLSTLTIPQTVTSIDAYAFFGCESLKTIQAHADNPNYSAQNGILFNKNKTELLFCPKGKEGTCVLPDGVKKIRQEAFSACREITTVTLPASVSAIGQEAFYGCTSLKSISLPEGISVIEADTFRDCTFLESVTLPGTITRIGDSAFYCCRKLRSIQLPGSLTQIGDNAFDGCMVLNNVVLPQGLKTIGDEAFSGCLQLSQIILPKSLTSLGQDAFFDCQNLKNINVQVGNAAYTYYNGAVLTRDSQALLYCPEGKEGIYYIPSGTVTVAPLAFNRCKKLTAVVIPDSITEIADDAFTGCEGLTLHGSEGSYAQRYAGEHQLSFSTESLTLTNISSLSADTVAPGQTLTVHCAARYPNGDCQYAVYYKKAGDPAWTCAQSFSSQTEVAVTLSESGNYEIQVQVRDKTGKNISKLFPLTVNSSLANLSEASAEELRFGEKVTLQCAGGGGAGNYQYAVFYKQDAMDRWICAQKYSTNSTVVIRPKAITDYTIRVRVKDAVGKVVRKTFHLHVNNALRNTSRLSSASVSLGKSVRIRCIGKNGTGEYTYAVFYKQKQKTGWVCAQNYETNDLVTITPQAATDYDIRVKVRDSSGKQDIKDFSLTVNPVLANTSRISSSSVSLGKSVRVRCSGKDGSGALSYAVYYKQSEKTGWICAQNFDANDLVTITPKTATAYDIRVKVKDSNGKQAVKNFSLTVNPVLTNTSRISASTISFGKSVRVRCAGKNGSGDLSYAVYYKQSEKTGWTCAQNFDANDLVTIHPKAATAYDIRVKVKDSSGKQAVKDFSLTVNPVLTNTSRISASTISLGKSVRVRCAGKNGRGDLSYAVYYKQASKTSWTCAQQYDGNDLVIIKPKAAVTYDIRVKVKDSSGKQVSKDFTLTVNK